MPPPAQERWAILAGIPKVVKNKVAKRIFPPDTDIDVACNELLRASVLTVPRRLSSPPSRDAYPYVAAADRYGLLLLCGFHPTGTFSHTVSYHICDARTGRAVSLSDHMRPMGCHGANIGLITSDDGRVVAAELQPGRDGRGRATLLSYKVGDGRWVEKELAYSPPLNRHFFGEGVVSHAGMLWWVDLSYGILACDPFSDHPELLYVRLPQVLDELPASPVSRGVHRCVKESGGRLRYVQIHGNSDTPVVSLWALADPAIGDWILERRVALADVWADESYRYTMLPRSIPALAFLHPKDPDMVNFFLDSCIFTVNMRLRKVARWDRFEMPDPPCHLKRSSHFVHAWDYHPLTARPAHVSACLTQDKVAERSLYAIMPMMFRTAENLRKLKQLQQGHRDSKRRKISGEEYNHCLVNND